MRAARIRLALRQKTQPTLSPLKTRTSTSRIMAMTLVLEERIEVPMDLRSLARKSHNPYSNRLPSLA